MRAVVDRLTRSLAWIGKGRRIRPAAGPVKVNLGSGLTVAEGWIHVDGSLNALLSRWPASVLRLLYPLSDSRAWYTRGQYVRILKGHRFVHHRLEYGLPFPDESVDCLYSSHVLEHFFRDDAEKFLREAHRVLKRGGRIRITVPDLAHAVALYGNGEKEQALSYFFSLSRSGSLDRHQYLYDFDLLNGLLTTVGFKNVARCAFREGKVPDLDRLDNRPEETLFVEAMK